MIIFKVWQQSHLKVHHSQSMPRTFEYFDWIYDCTSLHLVVAQALSHVWLFAIPRTAACQVPLSFSILWSLLKFMSTESRKLSNHFILCLPIFVLPSIFPSIRVFPVSQLFISGGQSTGVSAAVSVLPMNIQGLLPLWLTGLSSLQSKDSQESSPTPLFESINSPVHSHLYGPTLTSVHNYWKNHSFDYMDLCQQSNVFAF